MPATQVSPQLRRQLSDEARRLIVDVLGHTNPASIDISHMPLPERLQNFRAQVKLEIPSMDISAQVVLIVSGVNYCYRYYMAGMNADLCVLNKGGSTTKWILHANGQQEQLRSYMAKIDSVSIESEQISSCVDLVDMLDLLEVFRASQNTIDMGTRINDDGRSVQRLFSGPSNGHSFVFEMDARTGQPVMVLQEIDDDTGARPQKLRMIVNEYVRYEEQLEAPPGILSDVRIMVDVAMDYFSNEWMPQAQKYIMDIFDEIDQDGDGCISGADVCGRLEAAGQTPESAKRTSMEMVRLLCDQNDPSEEFDFHQFCGFWMAMLSDGQRVVDPSNQIQMIKAFRQLFCGEMYFVE